MFDDALSAALRLNQVTSEWTEQVALEMPMLMLVSKITVQGGQVSVFEPEDASISLNLI